MELTKELKKMEHEDDDDTYCNWRTWNGTEKLGNGAEGNGILMTKWGYPNSSIIKIDQNTQKNPWDSRKLVVIHT